MWQRHNSDYARPAFHSSLAPRCLYAGRRGVDVCVCVPISIVRSLDPQPPASIAHRSAFLLSIPALRISASRSISIAAAYVFVYAAAPLARAVSALLRDRVVVCRIHSTDCGVGCVGCVYRDELYIASSTSRRRRTYTERIVCSARAAYRSSRTCAEATQLIEFVYEQFCAGCWHTRCIRYVLCTYVYQID